MLDDYISEGDDLYKNSINSIFTIPLDFLIVNRKIETCFLEPSVLENSSRLMMLGLRPIDKTIEFTPGSIVGSGFYIEVDLTKKNRIKYCYTPNRLIPTTKKGHRCVKLGILKIPQVRIIKNA